MKEFKIKSANELYEMLQKVEIGNLNSCKDVISYIGLLEQHLSSYQMTLDQITSQIDSHNVNVTR